jgi:predicted metalloenzyme YecM
MIAVGRDDRRNVVEVLVDNFDVICAKPNRKIGSPPRRSTASALRRSSLLCPPGCCQNEMSQSHARVVRAASFQNGSQDTLESVPSAKLLPGLAAFYEQQVSRCEDRGIDARSLPLSHVAVRTRTWRAYVEQRDELERHCAANLENIWNGRPISKLLLAEPIPLGRVSLELVELIPPFHQRVYRMGLEHIGFVIGDDLEDFSRQHRAVLTGQQFQSPRTSPSTSSSTTTRT